MNETFAWIDLDVVNLVCEKMPSSFDEITEVATDQSATCLLDKSDRFDAKVVRGLVNSFVHDLLCPLVQELLHDAVVFDIGRMCRRPPELIHECRSKYGGSCSKSHVLA